MDPDLMREIMEITERYQITREQIEMDLDTRDNYPGEFYIMPLCHVSSENLRKYLSETDG